MTQIVYPKPIMCQHCGQYTTTPLWVNKHIGKGTSQFAFCNEDHANAFYLNRLNNIRSEQ